MSALQVDDAQKSDNPGRGCWYCGQDTVRVCILRDTDTGEIRVTPMCVPCRVEYRNAGDRIKVVHLVGDIVPEEMAP